MRLVFYFIILVLLTNCNHKAKDYDNPSIILVYINSTIISENYDIRIYNSPPPPELKDSINLFRSIKQDSLTKNLKPLRIFIGDSILFTKTLNYKKKSFNKEFSFLKNITENAKQSIYLDISPLIKQKGIILESINKHLFFKNYPNIEFEDDYGGFISFQNLFISENRKKAYFEVNYFKHNLNSVSYVVFAEFQDGEWRFQSEIISIS